MSTADPAKDAVKQPTLARTLLKVALVLVLLVGAAAAILLPAMGSAREAARKASCQCRLKQIGLALQNYLSQYGAFPPAYTVDADGKPMHSWRALILPCFEAGAGPNYNFAEPWDSPANLKVLDQLPDIFRCPSDRHTAQGMTNYMAVVGDETLWPNSSGRKVDEISDGLSNTIAVVEMKGLEIPWTKPFDLEFTKMSFQINSGSTSDIASRHGGGANLLMADGSVRYIQQIDPNLLRGFLTVAGGEDTSPP